MFPVPIIASDSARSITRTIAMTDNCAQRLALMGGFSVNLSGRFLVAMPVIRPCCQPWPVQRTDVSYRNTSFDIEQLTELLVYDRNRNPSKYAVVLVSEGASL